MVSNSSVGDEILVERREVEVEGEDVSLLWLLLVVLSSV